MADTLFEGEDVALRATSAALVLSGRPGFDTAARLAEAGRNWLEQVGKTAPESGRVSFDVHAIETTSSAVLCMLLEWLRTARQAGLEVEAIELPERMHDLAELSGLAAVLKAGAAPAGA